MLAEDNAVGPRERMCDRQRASDLYDRARVSWHILAASTQLVYAKTLLKRRLESAMNSILAHCKNPVCDKSRFIDDFDSRKNPDFAGPIMPKCNRPFETPGSIYCGPPLVASGTTGASAAPSPLPESSASARAGPNSLILLIAARRSGGSWPVSRMIAALICSCELGCRSRSTA